MYTRVMYLERRYLLLGWVRDLELSSSVEAGLDSFVRPQALQSIELVRRQIGNCVSVNSVDKSSQLLQQE